jgi:hypothetical protein
MRISRKPMALLSFLASFALLFLPAGAQEPTPQLFLMADALFDVSRAVEYEAASRISLPPWPRAPFPLCSTPMRPTTAIFS